MTFNEDLNKLICIMEINGLKYSVENIAPTPECYYPIDLEIGGYCVGISDIGNIEFKDRNIIVVPLFTIDEVMDFSGLAGKLRGHSNFNLGWYFEGQDLLEYCNGKFTNYKKHEKNNNINTLIVFYKDEKNLLKWKLRV